MGTASEDFDVAAFERKLNNLKDSADSIQSVSSWCLQNRNNHKKIVSSWLTVLKYSRIEQRLTLFYLANDVIQYSKRKQYEFVESWGTTLQRATTMVRDDKIKQKILRIFSIWKQRGVYNDEFLADLNDLLCTSIAKKKESPKSEEKKPSSHHRHQNHRSHHDEKKTTAQEDAARPTNQSSKESSAVIDIDDFQSITVVSTIRDCVKLESETDTNIKDLNKMQISDFENIKLQVKDRGQVEEVEKEITSTISKYETVILSLNAEIKARHLLITAIEQADMFFEVQRGEVKVVTNAYRNFGNRIKNMKKKLEEMQSTLPSPIPSPDINAPSPEPDNDFVFPDENEYSAHQANMTSMMSYIGGKLPFDLNDFSSESSQPFDKIDAVQPIEVINSRHKDETDDNNLSLNDFFKTYLAEPYTPSNVPLPVPPAPSYPAPQHTYHPVQSAPMNNINPVPPSLSHPFIHHVDEIPAYTSHDAPFSSTIVNQSPLLPPPPLPPTVLDHCDVYNPCWDEDNNNEWDSSDLGACDPLAIETPVSPPHFEREGRNSSILEYRENDRGGRVLQDVDHRQLNFTTPEDSPMISGMQMTDRCLDVDHRNLISLTGSPVIKLDDNMPKPVSAPALLWTGDVDFRQQMKVPPPLLQSSISMNSENDALVENGGDKDYRVPPLHKTPAPVNPNKQNLQTLVSTPPPISTKPLEPPPLLEMDEFLKNSSFDTGIDLPVNIMNKPQQTQFGTSNIKLIPSQKFKNPDNVESVDMEMSSDEDFEEKNFQNRQHNMTMRSPPPSLMGSSFRPQLNRSVSNNNGVSQITSIGNKCVEPPQFAKINSWTNQGQNEMMSPQNKMMNNHPNMFQNILNNSIGCNIPNNTMVHTPPKVWDMPMRPPQPQFGHSGGMGSNQMRGGPPQFFQQNRHFSPQGNNFRGPVPRNGGGGSPYFRPQRGGGGGFRGKFRGGNNNRGGMW